MDTFRVLKRMATRIFAVLLFAQVSVTRTVSLQCYECNNALSLNSCNTTKLCHDNQVCFLHKTSCDLYNMGCIDNQQCGRSGVNATSVVGIVGRETHSKRQTQNVCHECCSSNDFCNVNLCSHNTPSQCMDDETIDCAKIHSVFDVCKDVQHARTVCPKFCGLCNIVDGHWSDWSNWTACDVTCGNGTMSRTRTCTNPSPAHGGLNCTGMDVEHTHCMKGLCPVHGGWSNWNTWTDCSVTCGIGLQNRHRTCSNPYPGRFGDHCFGDNVIYTICTMSPCANGGWSIWGEWSRCSTTCGTGLRTRHRLCNNPSPSLIGHQCLGSADQSDICNNVTCAVGQQTNVPVASSITTALLTPLATLTTTETSTDSGHPTTHRPTQPEHTAHTQTDTAATIPTYLTEASAATMFTTANGPDVCHDLINDCDLFGRSICVDNPGNIHYPYAKRFCPFYCRLCRPVNYSCKDAISNCDDFDGGDMCTSASYYDWAFKNCIVYCGLFPCDVSDCYDIKTHIPFASSGVYNVTPKGMKTTIDVYCDMDTTGGGWTVFQLRKNGEVDFYRTFSEYEFGFGNLSNEFWLGLKYIQLMSSHSWSELRFDLTLLDNSSKYEEFKHFYLSPGPAYTLHIDNGTGTAGDNPGLSAENGANFYTKDRDNNVTFPQAGCALGTHAGWWFSGCTWVNLNGLYNDKPRDSSDNVKEMTYFNNNWYHYIPLKASKMMLRKMI